MLKEEQRDENQNELAEGEQRGSDLAQGGG